MIYSNNSSSKKQILVRENDYGVWKPLLEIVFPGDEYQLIEFTAVENFENFNYSDLDLILCDYFLEKNLRGDKWLKDYILDKDTEIPVIFWTSSMSANVVKSTILGSEVFFKKQLDLDLFKAAAERLIDNRRMQKAFPIYNSFFNQHIKNRDYKEFINKAYIEASRFLESFFGQSKYHAVFNAHGLIHIQRVIDNLAVLMRNCLDKEGKLPFSEEDFLAVYLAALLHDLGMIPDEYNEYLELKQFKALRKSHCLRIFKLFYEDEISKKLKLDFGNLSADPDYFRKKVAFIALYHDSEFPFSDFLEKEVKEKINQYLGVEIDSNLYARLKEEKYLKVLTGLLALADKMDYGKTRVPVEPMRQSNLRGLYDEFEYIKNESIERCEITKSASESTLTVFYRSNNSNIGNISNYFESFSKDGFDEDGLLQKKGIDIAVQDLIQNVFTSSWKNIRSAFSDSDINFLRTLKLAYKNIHNFKFKIKLPDENNNIKKVLKNGDKLDWQENALINYIFKSEKFQSLTLIQIAKGFSGARVFYVENIKLKDYPGQRVYYSAQNKFLKIGHHEKIHTEVQNYKKIAILFLPQESTIGYVEEFKFLEKAGYLGSIIQDDNSGVIEMAEHLSPTSPTLSKCVSDAFEIFYSKIEPNEDKNGVLGFYRNLCAERKSDFEKIDDLTRKESALSQLAKFLELLAKIQSISCIKLHASLIHGDFTFRNILKSSDNLVFIDFAESGWGHFFFDFAKMDHYLRFEFLEETDNYLDKESCLIVNGDGCADNLATPIYSSIWGLCHGKSPFEDAEFYLQKCLASAYMNLWCIPYRDDTINLKFDERIELFNLYHDKITEVLNGKHT